MTVAETVSLVSIFVSSIGILLAEKKTAVGLGIATIMLTIIFFIV